ncbi:MAG: hypothetical protein N2C14_05680, partial [Planctomycetales bacterium]
ELNQEPAATIQLDGGLAWGPRRVGERVLLSTQNGKLLCLGNDAKPIWESSSVFGSIVGVARTESNGFVLASADGRIWSVNEKTGKMIGEPVSIGRPLTQAPFVSGDRLLVASSDGGVHWLRKPISQLFVQPSAAGSE